MFLQCLETQRGHPYLPSFPENIKETTPVAGKTSTVLGRLQLINVDAKIHERCGVQINIPAPSTHSTKSIPKDSKRTSPQSVQYSVAISFLCTAFTFHSSTHNISDLKVLEGGKVFRKPESGWMASEQLQNMTLVVTHDTLKPEHPKQSSFNRSVAEPGKLPYPTSQTDRVLRTRLNALEGHVDRRRDVVLQLRC